MRKIVGVVSVILIFAIIFSACGAQEKSLSKTSPTVTENSMQEITKLNGYTIEELQRAVISALNEKDADSILQYVLPEADSAIRYAYEQLRQDTSVLVDLQITNIDVMFENNTEKGIVFGNSAEYTEKNLTVLSKASIDDSEELELIFNDIKNCLKKVGCTSGMTDFAIFEIRVEDDSYSVGITTLVVNTSNGWFIFGFDS